MKQGSAYRMKITHLYESSPVQIAVTAPQDTRNEWDVKPDPALVKQLLPPEYHDYLDVFDKATADALPERRSYDHKIPIMEGKEIPPSRLFPLSATELDTLRNYIDENLR